MYIRRYLSGTVLEVIKTFKVLYLGGPRQVGKTTLLHHLAKELAINYVSLDDIGVRQTAKNDPKLFIEDHPAPLLIDEIQYAPELLSYIKIKVDASDKRGQYWLTGSQQFKVMRNLQESLAGRVGILNLLGLSQGETDKKKPEGQPFLPKKTRLIDKVTRPVNSQLLFRKILTGFFPALYLKNHSDLNIFYRSYVQTYMDRDLREIYGINKTMEFHRFLQLCAGRTGQILSYSDLARDAGVSVHAAKEWIDILENTMQIYLLRPYYPNLSKRIIKAPKLYFLDTGLATYLTKWQDVDSLKNGAMAGAFFETLVVAEIIKSYIFRGKEPPVYYFRDKEGHEIDLLIESGRVLHPIEIKLASQINTTHSTNLNYLYSQVPGLGQGAIVCLSPERYRLTEKIEVVPYSLIN